jgi:hypothetical protein
VGAGVADLFHQGALRRLVMGMGLLFHDSTSFRSSDRERISQNRIRFHEKTDREQLTEKNLF